MNQEGVFNQYKGRKNYNRPFEIYSEVDQKTGKTILLTKIQGLPSDGRLVTESTFR